MEKFFLFCILVTVSPIGFCQERTAGGESYHCRFEMDTAMVKEKVAAYYPLLKTLRKPNSRTASGDHPLLAWPMRASGNYDQVPNYYVRGNGVDNDITAGVVDYNCNGKSYNGHTGTDIGIWPFGWYMMNKKFVQAAAAAPGVVVTVSVNTNNSYNCNCEDNNNNYIMILHADSSTSSYVHLFYNSARVNEGDIVEEGQLLADIGSSGCSSGPHLHFEIRDKNNLEIDPWVGPNTATDCNTRSNNTWWQNQTPYYEPQINRLMTHGSLPVLDGFNGNNDNCPGGESINARNNFSPGDKVYLGWGMYDWLSNTSIIYSVFAPDGSSIYNNIRTNQSPNHLLFFYKVDSIVLPANVQPGTYMFDANYQGVNYKHFFTVNCLASYNLATPITNSRSFIAASHINSNSSVAVGQTVLFQAGNYIQFNPGFSAPAGTTFKARIKDCNYSE